jgi:NAD(P)-dependent dehydrogenase (short-subunit alcohol dehydrogenase family)
VWRARRDPVVASGTLPPRIQTPSCPCRWIFARPNEIEAAIAQAEAWHGGIDVLVNNAGIGYAAAIEEGEDKNVRAVFETNVFGLINIIRAALPAMRGRGRGTIVNISSTNGVVSMPGLGFYSASKHAVEAITDALRGEVAPLGLKVLTVEPGGFRTGIAGVICGVVGLLPMIRPHTRSWTFSASIISTLTRRAIRTGWRRSS